MSFPNYPTRQYITSLERRLQDTERRIENMHRVGKIPKDGVKFDEEKKRWYVKLEDGTGDDAFKTDWLPWETIASGWLKISCPPKEGQHIQLSSPSGNPETASCRPYHNNPDNPSPHDKPDEFFMRVEMPSQDSQSSGSGSGSGSSGSSGSGGQSGSKKEDKILDFHYTQDGATVKIGDTTHQLTKDTISHKTKNNTVETEKDSTKATESHSLETKKRTVKAEETSIDSTKYSVNGKVLINC